MPMGSRDSAVGMATRTEEGSDFESWWGQEFSLLHVVQTGSGVRPAYLMDTRESFSVSKAVGT
jgi:hypothetical protein